MGLILMAIWRDELPVMGDKNTLRPGVDYDESSCPACGDPGCDFPPACQRVVMDAYHDDTDWWEMRSVR